MNPSMTNTTAPAALTVARAADVRSAYAAERAKGLRAKDAAEAHGGSEGEAIAAHAAQLLAGSESALQVRPLLQPEGGWIERHRQRRDG